MKAQTLIWAIAIFISLTSCSDEVPVRDRNSTSSGLSGDDKVSRSDDLTIEEEELTPEQEEEVNRVYEEYEDFFDEDIFKPKESDTDLAEAECKVGKNMKFFLAVAYIGVDQLLVNQDVRYQGLLPVIEYFIDQSTEIQTGQNYELIASEIASIVQFEFSALKPDEILIVEKGVYAALKALNFSCEDEKLQLNDVFDFVIAVIDSLPDDFGDQLNGFDINYLKVLIKGFQ